MPNLAVSVDETTQELADEYTDILEKISDLVADYSDYLADIGNKNLIAELSFDRFTVGLKSNTYGDDPDILRSDLDAYLRRLDKVDQSECGNSESQRTTKGCRVVRGLKREMKLISEQLDDYEEQLGETSRTQTEVRKALKEAMKANKEISKQTLEITRKALEQAAKELERIDLTAPQAPHGTSAPTPPVRSYTKTKKGVVVSRHPTAAGTQRTANGVITVTSTSLPVMISNPNGSIEVTGSTRKTIEASLDFEVSSSSRAREKKLADSITFQLSGERNGYQVSVAIPTLSDPNTQIVRNDLVVSVPAGMRLICKAAYGTVNITGMTGSVDAASSYGPMDISDCNSRLKANCAFGELTISNCSGDIEAQNSYSAIEINECNGTIAVINAYSPVSVSRSRGRLTIGNTGEISVTEHTGPVAITNQNGAVSVTDVRGDIRIQNAYQAITAENISGQVYIENSYSPIVVSGISGRASLINRFSSITGESLSGPFDVSSQNGEIELTLDRTASGPSVINATYGSVRLEVSKTANLLISARLSNGDITSVFPVERTAVGAIRSGIIRLGSARDSLSIVGTNAGIEISGHR